MQSRDFFTAELGFGETTIRINVFTNFGLIPDFAYNHSSNFNFSVDKGAWVVAPS